VSCIKNCCRRELEMPIAFKDIQTVQYSARVSKANILGSYKLINNPVYGHAVKAYKEVILKQKKSRMAGLEDTRVPIN